MCGGFDADQQCRGQSRGTMYRLLPDVKLAEFGTVRALVPRTSDQRILNNNLDGCCCAPGQSLWELAEANRKRARDVRNHLTA